METGTHACELSPPARAQYFKGLKATSYEEEYLKVMSHPKFCHSNTYVSIKDPNFNTIIIINGPGGTAWNYSLTKFLLKIYCKNKI